MSTTIDRSRTWIIAAGCLLLWCLLLGAWCPGAGGDDPADEAFFEARIRPVLIDRCYACHNAATVAEGGLAVDSRDGLLDGGDSGPALVPGKPAESLLVRVLKHEVDGLKMPKDSGRLAPESIADFTAWIAAGAVDPRDAPPSATELAAETSWEAVRERRRQWWAFQPLRDPPQPETAAGPWAAHPVDRFIAAGHAAAGVEPASVAPPAALVRRAFFALVGLPPTPAEQEEWTTRVGVAGGWEALVDRLLASPHFGERWARHWMDWIRYADTHGSEGDPEIVGTHLYRDALIRALNADVPVDRLLREHVAGDLVADPRLDPTGSFNDSAILTAHWRMVFHGYSPTDALEEKVRFVDDQVNAFSKAFLGLTVSCARCHNHKFDPISQRDYYALFGVLGSCRPGRLEVGPPAALGTSRAEILALEAPIRTALAGQWRHSLADLRRRLDRFEPLATGGKEPRTLLHPLFAAGADAADTAALAAAVAAWRAALSTPAAGPGAGDLRWDLAADADRAAWSAVGSGLMGIAERPRAGDTILAASGPRAVDRIMPAAVKTHRISTKHGGRLTSPVVRVEGPRELWVLAAGGGGATLRYVVEDYPRGGPVYPITQLTPEWKWHRFDLAYWDGDRIHVELATARDAVLPSGDAAERSWFAVREARLVTPGTPPALPADPRGAILERLGDSGMPTVVAFRDAVVAALGDALTAWSEGRADDRDALLLDTAMAEGLLENRLDDLAVAGPLAEEARRLEALVPVLPRAPAPEETGGHDQPLLARGDHHTPGPPVPRGFPSLFGNPRAVAAGSGRREVADDLLSPANPLTRRVIVNRVWHHLFGRGIVATPDNLGHLGQKPTHPELLDHLAVRFESGGWSLKGLIRHLVTSRTWRLDSLAPPGTMAADPDTRLWSRALVRRLDAEAIRDSLLATSGALDPRFHGPPADGGSGRRGVYVRVARNAIDPLLRVFDFPEPFSSTGARDETNVPAQALTLLNDPQVARLAEAFAARILADTSLVSDEARLDVMVRTALGRPGSAAERAHLGELLGAARAELDERARRRAETEILTARARAGLDVLLESVRAARPATGAGGPQPPAPLFSWDFSRSLDAVEGNVPGTAHGGASVRDGALVVADGGHVTTAPLPRMVGARTLSALVQLDSLGQQGGGVMSIQSADGVVFDAIVFAEQAAGEWLAGSNGFQRTRPFSGPRETEAAGRPVHVAISWGEDGTVRGYRDGSPYGEPYRVEPPVVFPAGSTVVSFGLRHLPAGGNRLLAGRIIRAALHDRALSAAEVGDLAAASGSLSLAALIERLPEARRGEARALLAEIDSLAARGRSLQVPAPADRDRVTWAEPARALFLCKEFIFLR
jgi:hypothetical protein